MKLRFESFERMEQHERRAQRWLQWRERLSAFQRFSFPAFSSTHVATIGRETIESNLPLNRGQRTEAGGQKPEAKGLSSALCLPLPPSAFCLLSSALCLLSSVLSLSHGRPH